MDNNIRKILIRLLRDYRETLSYRGCNDFVLERTPENLELARTMGRDIDTDGWTYSPKGKIVVMDSDIVNHCIKLLKKEIEDERQ